MKVSLSKVRVRGAQRWMVSWKPVGGARARRFFGTKAEAEALAEDTRTQQDQAGSIWLALSAVQRNTLIAALAEADREGFTLMEAINFYRANRSVPGHTIKLGDAFARFIEEKQALRLSPKTLAALRSNAGRFVAGREQMPLGQIHRAQVMEWLQRPEWGPRTFNTYLISVKTFFKWCVACDLLVKSPAANLAKIGERQMPDLDTPPVILSLAQCEALLKATLNKDKALVPYVAVCLFAGLRPEREAGHLAWADLEGAHISVRGLHAKDRQRRLVDIHPTLAAWLKLKGDLPPRNLRRRMEVVRAAAGLIRVERATATGRGQKRVVTLIDGKLRKRITETGWAQDCLRHTFASNYLPVFGAEKTVAQMGHGDYTMLFRHYRTLVKEEDARKFWELTPKKLKCC